MQAHLTEDIGLAEIAKVTRLSQSSLLGHFVIRRVYRLTDTFFAHVFNERNRCLRQLAYPS
jgi:hypothetical protein